MYQTPAVELRLPEPSFVVANVSSATPAPRLDLAPKKSQANFSTEQNKTAILNANATSCRHTQQLYQTQHHFHLHRTRQLHIPHRATYQPALAHGHIATSNDMHQ